jgi:hypothetical protein
MPSAHVQRRLSPCGGATRIHVRRRCHRPHRKRGGPLSFLSVGRPLDTQMVTFWTPRWSPSGHSDGHLLDTQMVTFWTLRWSPSGHPDGHLLDTQMVTFWTLRWSPSGHPDGHLLDTQMVTFWTPRCGCKPPHRNPHLAGQSGGQRSREPFLSQWQGVAAVCDAGDGGGRHASCHI